LKVYIYTYIYYYLDLDFKDGAVLLYSGMVK
jgi:hypothetical protein